MKRLALSIAALALLATAAAAKDITITMTDQDQQNIVVVAVVLDQCVSAVALRNEPSACKNVQAFLSALADKVKAAAQAAAVATPDPAEKK